MGCSGSAKIKTNTFGNGPDSFDVQGHRGCRGLLPENTIPAFIRALDLGVTTLELDVVITRDSQVLVSHEPWFNRNITTKPGGSFMAENEERALNIYQMTYAETQAFDVGLKPYPAFPRQEKIKTTKPRLADVFDSVRASMMTRRRPDPFFNIEIKSDEKGDGVYHPAPVEFVRLVMDVIREKKMEKQVNIQSFDFRPLRILHKEFPSLRLAMLIDGTDRRSVEEQLTALGFTPAIYSPHWSLVNPERVRTCHEKGMKIIPWTVNDKSRIDSLRNLGVDGIITDYPDLFQ
ncbi:MAG: glycerophosphodiester phosphodiesterase family protein [Chitinophagaceae bacterium]